VGTLALNEMLSVSADDPNTWVHRPVNSKLLTRSPLRLHVYNLGSPFLEVVGMPIRQVIGNLAFEPADVEAMERALEAACVVLRLSKREESLRQIVARKVIEVAATGERDPEVLCQMVVSELEREALEDCGDSNSADVA
jgi:hypothetical protein